MADKEIVSFTGSNPPFGYQWENDTIVIVPGEASIYKEMFELFLVHQRKRTVARLLNDKGYRTRTGKEFTYSTVARLLENSIAKGERKIRQTRIEKTQSGEKKRIDEIISISVEPIVSEEVWNQVNSIINQQKGTLSRKPAKYILSGKTHCTCGGKMYVPHKSKNYVCQKCRSKILIDDLHHIFHEKLKEVEYSQSDSLYAKWPDLSRDDRWQIGVDAVTDCITVGRGEVTLSHYSLS